MAFPSNLLHDWNPLTHLSNSVYSLTSFQVTNVSHLIKLREFMNQTYVCGYYLYSGLDKKTEWKTEDDEFTHYVYGKTSDYPNGYNSQWRADYGNSNNEYAKSIIDDIIKCNPPSSYEYTGYFNSGKRANPPKCSVRVYSSPFFNRVTLMFDCERKRRAGTDKFSNLMILQYDPNHEEKEKRRQELFEKQQKEKVQQQLKELAKFKSALDDGIMTGCSRNSFKLSNEQCEDQRQIFQRIIDQQLDSGVIDDNHTFSGNDYYILIQKTVYEIDDYHVDEFYDGSDPKFVEKKDEYRFLFNIDW